MLDDMDFDRYGKVKCSKIEGMLPKLMKMVEGEMIASITTYEDNKHCREAQGAVTNNSVICFNL